MISAVEVLLDQARKRNSIDDKMGGTKAFRYDQITAGYSI